MLVRLQKYLADAGVASRRASEQYIVDGRVSVNGRPVSTLGTKIQPGHDRIAVDGVPVKPRRKLYVAIHKPKGYVCTRIDPLKRKTLGDLLPKEWSHLYSIGRLDYESEGLIFATNDGDFCLKISHPRHGVRKKYVAQVEGRVDSGMLAKLTQGVVNDGEKLQADKAKLLQANNSHSIVELELTEGKNREVRRLFEVLGLTVSRLQRVQIGPIKLGELPVGKWRALTEQEIKSLLSQV